MLPERPGSSAKHWFGVSVMAGASALGLAGIAALLPPLFLLVFFTPMPVFMAGYWYGHRGLLTALASMLLGMLAGLGGKDAFSLTTIVLMPTLLTGHALLQVTLRQQDGQWLARWPTLVHSLQSLSLYFCVMTLGAGLFYWGHESSVGIGLQGWLRDQLLDQLNLLEKTPSQLPPEAIQQLKQNVTTASLSLVTVEALWQWSCFLALNAWLGWRFGREILPVLRPSPLVTSLTIPAWQLQALLLALTAMLIGSEQLAFVGQICCIILLLPYFLSAIVHAHKRISQRTGGTAFLVVLYFLLALSVKSAILVAAASVGWHVWQISQAYRRNP